MSERVQTRAPEPTEPVQVADLVEVVAPERDDDAFAKLVEGLSPDLEPVDAEGDEPDDDDEPLDDEPADLALADDEPANDEPANLEPDDDEWADHEPVEPAASAEPVEPARCLQCGTVLMPEDIFCGECGFVRHGASAARPRDTVSLDPFPWGAPTGPGPAALREEPVPTFDDDIDETRIVDRSARGERFVLQFSTGDSVSVSGTGLLGRNPVAEPGEFFDALVTISDPGKSVSKTHLEFGQEAGTFWVSDRYSGNGTVVRQPDTPARRCEAGNRYRVARGTRIDIGEQFFIVS